MNITINGDIHIQQYGDGIVDLVCLNDRLITVYSGSDLTEQELLKLGKELLNTIESCPTLKKRLDDIRYENEQHPWRNGMLYVV